MDKKIILDDTEITKDYLNEKIKESLETKTFKLKEISPNCFKTLKKLKE